MTNNCFIYSLSLEDDQTPLITSSVSGVTPLFSAEIKDIPFTARREKLTFDITGQDPFTWNYVRIESSHPAPFNNRWYKIVDMVQKSISDRISITLDIVLDPWSTASYTNAMTSVSGNFTRAPLDLVKQPFMPRPDQMKYSRAVDLPKLPVVDDCQAMLVKITGILEATSPWVTGSPHLAAGSYLTVLIFTSTDSAFSIGSSSTLYPSLTDIVNSPETCTPFVSATDIVDISVSIRPISTYTTTVFGGYPVAKLTGYGLQYASVTGSHWTGASDTFWMYYIANSSAISPEYEETFTITLSEYERLTGQLIIRDSYGTTVGTIDTRYGEYDANNDYVITLKTRTRATFSNIQTTVILPDDSEFTIVEGHLAFNTSAYAEYMVAQQQYDREMMRIQQDRSNLQIWQNAASSVASASEMIMLSGFGSLIGLGAGLAVNAASWNAEKQLSEQEQRAKEDMVKATPDSAYNPAFGIDYMTQAIKSKHNCVAISTPSTITSTELSNTIERFGYVCNDIYTTINESAMPNEGCIIAKSAICTLTNSAANTKWQASLFARWLREQLFNGIRYKKVSIA